ncbi:MAG: replicative DNA helicase [Chitinophagales bacterium]|nr:replicative DNA helicase [Chitinophagales bacterium]
METVNDTALAAEQGILASVIDGKFAGWEWPESLHTELFTDSRSRIIFQAVEAIHSNGLPLNRLIVKEHLIRKGWLESAGGGDYFDQLKTDIKTEEQVKAYVQVIRENAMRHKLKETGERFMELSRKGDNSAVALWETARKEFLTAENFFQYTKAPSISQTVKQFMNDMQVKRNSALRLSGLPTGISELDKITGGLGNGELIVIGGRPAMGKTAFVLCMVRNLISQQVPVVWFSLEYSCEMMVSRILSQEAGIPQEKVRRADLSEEEMQRVAEAAHKLEASPLTVIDEAAIRVDRIASLSRQLKAQGKVQLIVVDYLQLVGNSGRRNYDHRELQVAEICRGLKRLARDLDIPVVVISQLSRAVETRGGDKMPILSDLRESGSIEQDADKVFFLYRGEYYGIDIDCEGESTKGIAEIIVAKNRFGPVRTARARFNGFLGLFEDLPDSESEEETADLPIADKELKEKFKRVFMGGNDPKKFMEDNEPF